MYGMTEKQFRLTFQKAKNQRGVTGDIFLQLLESRLDSVIYRLGFAKSRSAARQFVGHGHIVVNGKKIRHLQFIVKEGDEIEVRERSSSRQLATRYYGGKPSTHRARMAHSECGRPEGDR